MHNKELVALIRKISGKLDLGNFQDIVDTVAPLRAFVLPGCHVGCGALMDSSEAGFRIQLEWYAGHLLKMVDQQQWFGISSWINCTEKFTTPKRPT